MLCILGYLVVNFIEGQQEDKEKKILNNQGFLHLYKGQWGFYSALHLKASKLFLSKFLAVFYLVFLSKKIMCLCIAVCQTIYFYIYFTTLLNILHCYFSLSLFRLNLYYCIS